MFLLKNILEIKYHHLIFQIKIPPENPLSLKTLPLSADGWKTRRVSFKFPKILK